MTPSLAVRVVATLLAVCTFVSCSGQAGRTDEVTASPSRVTAFVGVNVIPMDAERVLRDQIVIVNGSTIQRMGPQGQVRVPRDATVIDGSGRYLTPGLADLHTHLRVRGDLTLYLANGVTTILDLGSFVPERLLAFRDSLHAGTIPGPTLYVSYFMDGERGRLSGLDTAGFGATFSDRPSAAREGVRTAKRNGFDFIKVYNSLPDSAFRAIADEARTAGLTIIGHGVRSVGLEGGMAAGQRMIAHSEEYLYTFFESRRDTAYIPQAASFTKKYGAYVLPNLSTYYWITRQWGNRAQVDLFLADPRTRALDPTWRAQWNNSSYVGRQGSLGERYKFLYQLTKALSDSGVPLLLGTDSPVIPGLHPGYSIHEDLYHMTQAGLTPYQALAAGTRTAGDFIRRNRAGAEAFGTVAPGMRADLLLVDGNPLQNLRVLQQPAGVMARGRWHSRAAIDSMVRLLEGKP